MRWIKNIFGLFYPHFCYGCDEVLQQQEDVLCDACLLNLDLIPFTPSENNEIKRRFYGKLLVKYCTSVLYYSESGSSKKLLHQLKYHRQRTISTFLATLALQHLKDHEVLVWADRLVPIPLHPSKERKRGYNQLDDFGKTLSAQLHIPYCKDFLIKKTKSETQTRKNMSDRVQKNEGFIINPKYAHIQNQNILLVDDVMTTGATLELAGNLILKNSTNKISILTMAYTR